MTDEGIPGIPGYRCREEDGFAEVAVYLRPAESAGGTQDDEALAPGVSLDLKGLWSLFERVDDFSWQALGLNYREGPHVSIEGVYQGHEVFVRVLAYAPEDEEPGMRLDTSPPKH